MAKQNQILLNKIARRKHMVHTGNRDLICKQKALEKKVDRTDGYEK